MSQLFVSDAAKGNSTGNDYSFRRQNPKLLTMLFPFSFPVAQQQDFTKSCRILIQFRYPDALFRWLCDRSCYHEFIRIDGWLTYLLLPFMKNIRFFWQKEIIFRYYIRIYIAGRIINAQRILHLNFLIWSVIKQCIKYICFISTNCGSTANRSVAKDPFRTSISFQSFEVNYIGPIP